MLSRLKRLGLLVVLSLPLIATAKIIETASIADVIPLVDSDTWVVVDLDNTTFEGKQALGHTEWFSDKSKKLVASGMTYMEANLTVYPEWMEIQKICPVKPVEENFIPTLRSFQNQGIVVMGLTHRQPRVSDSTLRQINSLGFSFTPTAPAATAFSIPSSSPATSVLYDQGVIFAGEFNKKGEIFSLFLSLIKKLPKKVVFIDDIKRNVDDVENTLTELGVECYGIFYTATQNVEKVYDADIAEFQRKFLKKVMSNEAARLLMQHGIE
jgi:hypothetical protein